MPAAETEWPNGAATREADLLVPDSTGTFDIGTDGERGQGRVSGQGRAHLWYIGIDAMPRDEDGLQHALSGIYCTT